MLVRAGLDTAALTIPSTDSDAEALAATRRLLGVMVGATVLILASQADRDELITTIRALPADLGKLWSVALQELVVRRASPSIPLALAQVTTLSELEQHWKGRIRIGFLGQEKASALGLPDDRSSIVDGASDIEIARADLADDAERIREARRIAESDVPRNTDRDDVWDSRFALAAAVSTQVTIMDRYAVPSLLEGNGQGFDWFLQKLDAAGVQSVHIVSQATAAQVARVASVLASRQSGLAVRNISTLTLTLAEEVVFKSEAHARHIRFSPGAVGLDRGLTMFNRPRCGQSTPCGRGDSRACRDRENAVERRAIPGARRMVVW
jgi:hypothetical protein